MRIFSDTEVHCDVVEALHFLEEDVIPVVLLSDPELCCASCSSFLMGIARAVETEYPNMFPENSLQIASTMERVVQNLLSSTKTSSRQVIF